MRQPYAVILSFSEAAFIALWILPLVVGCGDVCHSQVELGVVAGVGQHLFKVLFAAVQVEGQALHTGLTVVIHQCLIDGLVLLGGLGDSVWKDNAEPSGPVYLKPHLVGDMGEAAVVGHCHDLAVEQVVVVVILNGIRCVLQLLKNPGQIVFLLGSSSPLSSRILTAATSTALRT